LSADICRKIPMEINTCQFSDSYYPIMDGVGITVHNYAWWLNAKYGKTSVVAPKVKGIKDLVDYKVYRFNSVLLPGMNPYRVGLPFWDVKFRKSLKKKNFDLIHAHSPFISGSQALKLARKLKVPMVATFHSKYRDDFKKVVNNDLFIDFMVKYTLEFYNKADYVWVPSKATGNTLREYGFNGIFEVMPNGCDMKTPEKTQLIKIRNKGLEEIGASKDEFVILFVGQHRWEKNVRLIIESLRALKASGKKFRMVFVGEGYASADMKQMVRKFNLKDQVHFAGVVTDRNRLKSYYAASDLFLFPSVYDNSPLVIQEAAAFEVPTVLVRGSSAAEPVMDGVNGFLCENDSVAMAEKIKTIMDHPDTMKNAGKSARKSIYHSWESVCEDVYDKYRDIIKEYRRRQRSLRKEKVSEEE
jgi:1,2-diacylglycerol 3-alpha-glucosyltransferase